MNKILVTIIVALIVFSLMPVITFAYGGCGSITCGEWSECSHGWQYRWCWWKHCEWSKWMDWQRCEMPCIPNWQCNEWGECIDGTQFRECYDSCGDTRNESQYCEMPCISNWICDSWSSCIDGKQTRDCSDGCGDTRIETQDCTMPVEVPKYTRPIGDGAWIPMINGKIDYENPCRMNTFVSKYCRRDLDTFNQTICDYVQPKRVFTICWDWVTDDYQEQWIQNYGDYTKQKEWITRVGKWKFTWWKHSSCVLCA